MHSVPSAYDDTLQTNVGNISHEYFASRAHSSPLLWGIQTQAQTKFIQQKQIQVQYQVYIPFMHIQKIISPWHINDYKHVGRPLLRLYLTADIEATRKEKSCAAVMETTMQLIVN